MSALGAWENFSLSRLKAPVKGAHSGWPGCPLPSALAHSTARPPQAADLALTLGPSCPPALAPEKGQQRKADVHLPWAGLCSPAAFWKASVARPAPCGQERSWRAPTWVCRAPMLKSTLPFSKARARCWAGSPVSESYLQGQVRLECQGNSAEVQKWGVGGEARTPRSAYQWKSGPRLRVGVRKRASRRQSWL